MKITKTFDVKSCGDCPNFGQISSDDAFTESWVRFYCKEDSDIRIESHLVIHKNCPIKKKQN